MKKNFSIALMLASFLMSGSAWANSSVIGDDENFIYIKSEGMGVSKIEALNFAWMEAIRTGVGMFMTSSTQINDDDLNEKITTFSRGRVKNYKIISEENINNLWKIEIEAAVEKDILIQADKITKKRTLNKDQIASFVTASAQTHNAMDTIDNFIMYNSPEDCLEYTFDIQNVDDRVFAFHLVKVNHKKFDEIVVKNISTLLDEVADEKIEVKYNPSYKDKHDKQVKQADNFSIPKHGLNIKTTQGDTILLSPVSNGRFEPYSSYYWRKKDMPLSYQDDRAQRFKKISIARSHKKCTSYFISDEELSNKIWSKLIGNDYDISFIVDIESSNKNMHFESESLEVRFFTSAYFSASFPSEGRIVYPLFQIKKGTSAQRSFYIFVAHELDIPKDEIGKVISISGGYELSHTN